MTWVRRAVARELKLNIAAAERHPLGANPEVGFHDAVRVGFPVAATGPGGG